MTEYFILCMALAIITVPQNSLGSLVDLDQINSVYGAACIPAVSETIITPFHRTDSVSIPTIKSLVQTATPVIETIPYTIHSCVDTPTLPYSITDTFLSVPAVDACPAATAGVTLGVADTATSKTSANVMADVDAVLHADPLTGVPAVTDAAVATNLPAASTNPDVAAQEVFV